MPSIVFALCVVGYAALESSASAQEFDRRLKTVYLGSDYGLSTYKSKLVDSNDTGALISYTIGANVGAEKTVAFIMRNDQSNVKFLLNESSIASSWQDTIIRYRWNYLYAGGVIGQTTWDVKAAGAELFAGTGSGYGLNLGVVVPLGARNLVTLDVLSVTASAFVEKNEQDVKMGPRMDLNLFSNIGLTRDNLDLIVGYRQRSHTLTFLGTSYAEQHAATYLGFQVGTDF